jgi:nucleoside-diphosphate-sugar epimerase
MKLLVIGGTGFLSSAVVEAGVADGHEVTILTRGQRAAPTLPQVRSIVADRMDEAAFRAALEGQTFDAVVDTICFNADQARQDVEVFTGRIERLVMISTDFVYTVGTRPIPTPEDLLRDSPTAYGQGKTAAEDVLFGATGVLPITILRPPHIVGKGGLLGTGSLQGRDAALPARLRRGEPVVLLEGGALLIQPADRRDIAAACLAVVEKSDTIGRAYNIAGPEAVTTRRYYEIVAEALGVSLQVVSLPSEVYVAAYPDRVSFTKHRAYATAALERDAGFRASVSLEESLCEMLSWLETNPPPGADALPKENEQALIALLQERDVQAQNLLS